MIRTIAKPLVILTLAAVAPLSASERENPRRTMPLRVGAAAPVFSAPRSDGTSWDSSDHVGTKIVVVYFFPAAFTTASGRQAERFEEELKDLRRRGVEVVGISGDSVETLRHFGQQHAIEFALLSDETGEIAGRFGVAVREGSSVRAQIDGRQQEVARKVTAAWRYFAIDLEGKIAFTSSRLAALTDVEIIFDRLAQDFWLNRDDKQALWIPSHDRHWKRLLTRQQYLVTRKSHTERKFTGEYTNSKTKGAYRCVGCGLVLFESGTKFDSGTGWPSFWDPAARDRIAMATDRSHGVVRMEVKCKRCDAHLGHVFRDGPPPTGHRYCINSAALLLDPIQPANNQ